MSTTRLRLGQLLVDAAMISQKDLDDVLAFQKTDGRRLGTLLVERQFINETQLTQILSHQLSVPWVSLLHIEFSRQLLNLVPHSVAERFCMVPIYVRHVRGQGQTLYVAMDDPSNDDGLRACKEHSGLPVKAMIAPPSDIRNAIRVYYGVTVQTSSSAPAAMPEAPVESRDTEPEAPSAKAEIVKRSTTKEPEAEAPVLEISESTVSSADLLAADPTLASTIADEHVSPEIALAVPALPSPPPPRAESPSSPEIPPPPETLPEPGQATPFVQARASSRVSVVEARPLPPMSERLRPVLEGLHDAPPATIDESFPPSSGPVDTIPEPRGRAPRMIALTLLDGTTISLPAPRKQKQRLDTLTQPAPDKLDHAEEEIPATIPGDDPRAGLTARDLIAALRAVCHGADPNEILGPNLRWEAVMAAMLSVLLKKGLVADWEFVDELRKI